MLRVFEAQAPENFGFPGTGFRFFNFDYAYLIGESSLRSSHPKAGPASAAPFEAILSLRNQLKSREIELIVVFVPPATAIFADYATNIVWDPKRDGRVDYNFRAFLEMLEAEGVNVIDLFEPLYAARYETGSDGKRYPIYLRQDWHWASLGAKIAAEQVAGKIKGLPWYRRWKSSHPVGSFEFREESELFWMGTVYHRIIAPEGAYPKESRAPNAPVQVICDSMGTVWADVQASFYDHLAARLQVPVGMTAVRGGATDAALRSWASRADIAETRTVIWLIRASQIASAQPWAKVSLDRKTQISLCDLPYALDGEWPSASWAEKESASVHQDRKIPVDLVSPRPGKAPPRIIWKQIQFGKSPVFHTGVALSYPPSASLGSVEFRISIDDVVVARKRLDPPLPRRAVEWEVDLHDFSGRTADFGLSAEPREGGDKDVAWWIEPEISDSKATGSGISGKDPQP